MDARNVLVTNGSNEAIYILASLYEKAAILQPTYGEYKRAFSRIGAMLMISPRLRTYRRERSF